MDRKKVLAKIQKCLALAASSNPHEAAAAMRQAQALMREYGVEEGEVLAAQVSEADARTPASKRPAVWESYLANMVGSAFGTQVFFGPGLKFRKGRKTGRMSGAWKFVGTSARPEVARYTFEVLLRRVRSARTNYIENELVGWPRAERTRKGDLFARAWVSEVKRQVNDFAADLGEEKAITAYLQLHYPEIGELKSTNRDPHLGTKPLDRHQLKDLVAGFEAAKDVVLHHAVNDAEARAGIGMTRQLQLEGGSHAA
ncbi:MAG: hypothetical protein GAK28_04399 [Luteibacter sp.]|uniref:DUF2786 domain-containing protein n=1 Tax=Luteibacter sp. TaxID=1886636 RepID=UPI0013803F7F|nr:DUF2786 domain-containing protein [Luteibacter sp.]KAF1003936.1 MAG: hypothetical protein GAK28_04399 [Luteibacter sp.]